MAPQIVIHATLYIDPVHMPEYLKELRKVIVEVTKEIECTMFEVLSKPDEPSVVRLVEAWAATMEWLMGVQSKKAYFAAYMAATQHMWLKPPLIDFLETVPGMTVISPEHTWDLMSPEKDS